MAMPIQSEQAITIQDVIFRFYLSYFGLMEKISYETDMQAFSRAARNAYFMVDSLYSITEFYMDKRSREKYQAIGQKFKEKYQDSRDNRKSFLVAESRDKINNLYLRLANDRLKIISSALGQKGIIKEFSAAAMAGDHVVELAGGQIVSDGDIETADDTI